jgi:hypothetical protein
VELLFDSVGSSLPRGTVLTYVYGPISTFGTVSQTIQTAVCCLLSAGSSSGDERRGLAVSQETLQKAPAPTSVEPVDIFTSATTPKDDAS